jgi:hypothetical protein
MLRPLISTYPIRSSTPWTGKAKWNTSRLEIPT